MGSAGPACAGNSANEFMPLTAAWPPGCANVANRFRVTSNDSKIDDTTARGKVRSDGDFPDGGAARNPRDTKKPDLSPTQTTPRDARAATPE